MCLLMVSFLYLLIYDRARCSFVLGEGYWGDRTELTDLVAE